MDRRHFLTTSAAAAALAAQPVLVHAQDKGKIIFMTPAAYSLAFSPVLFASASGLFEKEGVQVQVEAGRGAAQSIQLVAAKQVQAGRTGGANYMVARVNNNAPVIAFATIAQRSPFAIISAKSAPIEKPEDVIGKVIGMQSAGGSMEATLDLMLMRANIPGDKLRRERVADSAASYGMIESKRVDAFLGNTSSAIRLLAQNYPVTTLKMDDGIPGQVYVADEAILAANPEPYVTFTRAVHKGIQQLAAMDEAGLRKAIELMGSKFSIPGVNNVPVALADLRANMDLWSVGGSFKNALRCDPKHWTDAEALLRKADIVKGAAKPLYVGSVWERAVG